MSLDFARPQPFIGRAQVGGLLSPARRRHTEKEHVALTGSAEAGRRETRRGRLPPRSSIDGCVSDRLHPCPPPPPPALPEHVRCGPRRARCRRRWPIGVEVGHGAARARALERAPPARTPDARRDPPALRARSPPAPLEALGSCPPLRPTPVSSDLGSPDVIYERPQPSLPASRTCERVWSLQRF